MFPMFALAKGESDASRAGPRRVLFGRLAGEGRIPRG
jgi:hypothetical protein